MKPDWKDAPSWAVWLAQDKDGEWYWYEKRPRKLRACWIGVGNVQNVDVMDNSEWGKTLEKRHD